MPQECSGCPQIAPETQQLLCQRGAPAADSKPHGADLLGGALAFARGAFPDLVARQLRVTEGDAVERLAQNVLRCGLAVLAEEEPRRADEIGVPLPVGNDAGDVPLVLETIGPEHLV